VRYSLTTTETSLEWSNFPLLGMARRNLLA
jgi:hypothetical protein